MGFGGFTAAAARVVLGVESSQFNAGLTAAEAEFVMATARMGGATAELAERQLRAAVASERYDQIVKKLGRDSLEARMALAVLASEQRKIADIQNVSTASTARFERGLLAGSVRGLGFGHALTFASNAFLGGAGFIYAIHSAIEASSKFQGEMTLIQTQALKSHAEVERMTTAVQHLSGRLATGPMELAKGLYRIESAGYAGAHAIQVMTIAAKGARLGHSDLESTANSLIAAERSRIQIARGAEDGTNRILKLTRAMSTIDAIVGAGNMRMEDLTRALQSGVVPAARQFGVTLQELGAALDTLTIQGQPAELSATRLRYTIALLGASTPKAEKELRQLGIASGDIARQMREHGLIPALELLHHKLQTSNLSIEDQNRLLVRAYGGGRSSTTILALLQNLDMLKQRLSEIQKQGTPEGFAHRWLAQKATYEYAFARLRADAELTKIAIGNALAAPATHSADAIANWLEQEKNQERIRRDVKHGFDDVGKAVHFFADGLRQAAYVVHGFDKVLGGSGHTLKLLLELLVIRKLADFARGVNAHLLNPLRSVKTDADAATSALERLGGSAGYLPGGPASTSSIPGLLLKANEKGDQTAAAERRQRMTEEGIPLWNQVGSARDQELIAEQQARARAAAEQKANQEREKADYEASRRRTQRMTQEAREEDARVKHAKAFGYEYAAASASVGAAAKQQVSAEEDVTASFATTQRSVRSATTEIVNDAQKAAQASEANGKALVDSSAAQTAAAETAAGALAGTAAARDALNGTPIKSEAGPLEGEAAAARDAAAAENDLAAARREAAAAPAVTPQQLAAIQAAGRAAAGKPPLGFTGASSTVAVGDENGAPAPAPPAVPLALTPAAPQRIYDEQLFAAKRVFLQSGSIHPSTLMRELKIPVKRANELRDELAGSGWIAAQPSLAEEWTRYQAKSRGFRTDQVAQAKQIYLSAASEGEQVSPQLLREKLGLNAKEAKRLHSSLLPWMGQQPTIARVQAAKESGAYDVFGPVGEAPSTTPAEDLATLQRQELWDSIILQDRKDQARQAEIAKQRAARLEEWVPGATKQLDVPSEEEAKARVAKLLTTEDAGTRKRVSELAGKVYQDRRVAPAPPDAGLGALSAAVFGGPVGEAPRAEMRRTIQSELRSVQDALKQRPQDKSLLARRDSLKKRLNEFGLIEQGLTGAEGKSLDYSHLAANDPLLVQRAIDEVVSSGQPSLERLQQLVLPPGNTLEAVRAEAAGGGEQAAAALRESELKAQQLMPLLKQRGVVVGGGEHGYALGKGYRPADFHPLYPQVERYARAGGAITPVALERAFGPLGFETSNQLVDQLLRRGVIDLNPKAGEPVVEPGLPEEQLRHLASDPALAREHLRYRTVTPEDLLRDHGIPAWRDELISRGYSKEKADDLARRRYGMPRAEAESLAQQMNYNRLKELPGLQQRVVGTEPDFRLLEGLAPLPVEGQAPSKPPEYAGDRRAESAIGSQGLPGRAPEMRQVGAPTQQFPFPTFAQSPGKAGQVDAEQLAARADAAQRRADELVTRADAAEREAAAAAEEAAKAPAERSRRYSARNRPLEEREIRTGGRRAASSLGETLVQKTQDELRKKGVDIGTRGLPEPVTTVRRLVPVGEEQSRAITKAEQLRVEAGRAKAAWERAVEKGNLSVSGQRIGELSTKELRDTPQHPERALYVSKQQLQKERRLHRAYERAQRRAAEATTNLFVAGQESELNPHEIAADKRRKASAARREADTALGAAQIARSHADAAASLPPRPTPQPSSRPVTPAPFYLGNMTQAAAEEAAPAYREQQAVQEATPTEAELEAERKRQLKRDRDKLYRQRKKVERLRSQTEEAGLSAEAAGQGVLSLQQQHEEAQRRLDEAQAQNRRVAEQRKAKSARTEKPMTRAQLEKTKEQMGRIEKKLASGPDALERTNLERERANLNRQIAEVKQAPLSEADRSARVAELKDQTSQINRRLREGPNPERRAELEARHAQLGERLQTSEVASNKGQALKKNEAKLRRIKAEREAAIAAIANPLAVPEYAQEMQSAGEQLDAIDAELAKAKKGADKGHKGARKRVTNLEERRKGAVEQVKQIATRQQDELRKKAGELQRQERDLSTTIERAQAAGSLVTQLPPQLPDTSKTGIKSVDRVALGRSAATFSSAGGRNPEKLKAVSPKEIKRLREDAASTKKALGEAAVGAQAPLQVATAKEKELAAAEQELGQLQQTVARQTDLDTLVREEAKARADANAQTAQAAELQAKIDERAAGSFKQMNAATSTLKREQQARLDLAEKQAAEEAQLAQQRERQVAGKSPTKLSAAEAKAAPAVIGAQIQREGGALMNERTRQSLGEYDVKKAASLESAERLSAQVAGEEEARLKTQLKGERELDTSVRTLTEDQAKQAASTREAIATRYGPQYVDPAARRQMIEKNIGSYRYPGARINRYMGGLTMSEPLRNPFDRALRSLTRFSEQDPYAPIRTTSSLARAQLQRFTLALKGDADSVGGEVAARERLALAMDKAAAATAASTSSAGALLKRQGQAFGRMDGQTAMGLGLMLTMFGDQPGRILGLHGSARSGLASIMMGAGTGMMFGPMVLPKYGAAIGAGIGASFGVRHLIGGRAGSTRAKLGGLLGNAAEGAGVGALAGSLGGPLAPLSIPAGVAIGSMAGLTLGLMHLATSGDAAAKAMANLGSDLGRTQSNARMIRQQLFGTRVSIANDRVNVDQARQAKAAAVREERQTRGTPQHEASLNRLKQATLNLSAAERQLAGDQKLARQQTEALAKSDQKAKEDTDRLVISAVQAGKKILRTKTLTGEGDKAAAARAKAFAHAMREQAREVQADNPKLAANYRELAKIVEKTKEIPTDPKLVRVLLKGGGQLFKRMQAITKWAHVPLRKVVQVYWQMGGDYAKFLAAMDMIAKHPLGLAGADRAQVKALKDRRAELRDYLAESGHTRAERRQARRELNEVNREIRDATSIRNGPGGPRFPGAPSPEDAHMGVHSRRHRGGAATTRTQPHHPFRDPNSDHYYQHLEMELARAQARGNVPAQRRILHQERTWLYEDLKHATSDESRKQIWNMIGQVNSALASLDSAATRNGGLGVVPPRYDNAVQAAEQSGNKKAELKAYEAEAGYLRRQLARHDLSPLMHRKLEHELTKAEHKIHTLEKSTAASAHVSDDRRVQRLELRRSDALAAYYRAERGGSKAEIAELKKERGLTADYLREGGHSAKERRDAERRLHQLDREIAYAKQGSAAAARRVLATYNAEEAYLTRYEHNRHHTLKQRLEASKKEQQLERQETAFRKKMNGGLGDSGPNTHEWYRLVTNYEKARRTKTTKDDVKALKAEESYLKHYLDTHKVTMKQRSKMEHLISNIDLKLQKLIAGQNEQLKAMQQKFLSEQASFWATFASNDFHDTAMGRQTGAAGGTTVEVHQHFPHSPTKDGHREAHVARRAYDSAFD